MQQSLSPRPKRSFFRRVFAPVVAMGLLAGGGWGAYYYYDAEVSTSAPTSELNLVAHSASTTEDELRNLFDSSPQPTSTVEEPVESLPVEPQDRYAQAMSSPAELAVPPELPPLAEEAPAELGSPAAANAVLGDRYAIPASLTMEHDPPALEVVENETEVTRGQEPTGNPLREPVSPPDPVDFDAKAAFGAALGAAPQPERSIVKAPQQSSNDLTNALQQARPLQPAPTQSVPISMASDRYQAAPPIQEMPVQQDLPQASMSVASLPQQPAPPLEMQLPPQQSETPFPAQSPFGAPPASLQTARTSVPQMSSAPQPSAEMPLTQLGMTPTPGLANHPGTGRPGERLLEGAQSPSITIQKLAPEEIQVGKRCTFAIRIQNSSQRTAQNVQIRDEVPMGTELVGTAPRATVSGSEIIWDLGTLSPGEERTVEMELLPQEEGELGSVAMVSFAAQASAKSRCTRPELALRLSSKPHVHVGDQQLIQIEISNPGSGDATSVMLLETVPAGVSHEAGPALEFEVGTLRPGESRRLELVLSAEQAGKISNVMTAKADANLQVEASCEFEVIAPELQVSVDGPQRRFLERPATYRVIIDNPGTAPAKDVQLVTHLPKGMQFVSANNMGEYDSATHSVHWSLAELPASERGTVELVALPIEAGEQTLQVSTKARQGLEDQTDKQVTVEGLSALTFEVIDVEGLIEIGRETTYEIRVQNQGSKAAANVQVMAIMPAGIRPVNAQGETRHTVQGERVLFNPLPQLAPKAETVFRIQAQGVRPGDQRVRVQIVADDLQQPITKEVNTRVYADE